jgi:hypothetical protein
VGRTRVDNDHHPAGFWTNNAVDFIKKNEKTPFCIWLSYYGPHTPIVCSNPWADMYKPSDMRLPPNHDSQINDAPPIYGKGQIKFGKMTDLQHQQALAAYAGYVSQIDANVGRVLDLLRKLKLEKNTIVNHKYVHYENGGKPMEMLFDMKTDRWETRNVLADTAHAGALAKLRSAIKAWESKTEQAPMYPIEVQTKNLHYVHSRVTSTPQSAGVWRIRAFVFPGINSTTRSLETSTLAMSKMSTCVLSSLEVSRSVSETRFP